MKMTMIVKIMSMKAMIITIYWQTEYKTDKERLTERERERERERGSEREWGEVEREKLKLRLKTFLLRIIVLGPKVLF